MIGPQNDQDRVLLSSAGEPARILARYDGAGFDFNAAGRAQTDYDDIIKNGAPAGSDRSAIFHSVVGHLYNQGLTFD